MTKQEAQAAQHDLQHEKEVMRKLEEVYKEALKLVADKIKLLDERSEQEDKPSIAYQKSFQTAVQKQLADILQKLRSSSYTTIEQYINECYTDGVVETMYQLHSDGIPLILPIDQEKVIRAVQLESKLSKSLYQSVGEDVQRLKRQITSIISAGFAVGASLGDMENQIAARMIGDYRKMNGGALGRAKTIARTEGNRVANAARLDTAKEASKHGADLVKQWDSVMDRRTRPHHVKLDRQVRELDEPFEVDGHKAMAPHQFDIPSEDINCRCRCDIRPRWAVEDSEDDMKLDNENSVLVRIDSDTYSAFKNRYLQEAEKYREKTLTFGDDYGIIKENNKSVRLWYHEHIHNIPNEIPVDLPMEERAKKAFELRNYYRTEARKRMADEDTRAELDAIHPNPTFEELIESKMHRKKMTREEAIQDIYETAVKSNPEYDKRAGL